MKFSILLSITLINMLYVNSAFAVKPKKSTKETELPFNINIKMPIECTRFGEFTDEFEIRCSNLRSALQKFYDENPNAVQTELVQSNLTQSKMCDDVQENYVICKGNRYVLEKDAVNNIHQGIKKATDIILIKGKDRQSENAPK